MANILKIHGKNHGQRNTCQLVRGVCNYSKTKRNVEHMPN